MKKSIATLLTIFVVSTNGASAIARDDTPAASVSSGAITDYIKQERAFLRGKHKVNLVRKFIKNSSVRVKRFGNLKDILNLKGISLSGADLRDSTFTMASMIDANLKGADLRGAELVHVDFSGADLTNTDFRGADLSKAIFDNTNIEGTNFTGANLFKATFVKMQGIEDSELKKLRRKTISYIYISRENLPDYY